MRTRYVWDAELQVIVEIGTGSNRDAPEQRVPMSGVMPDIQPYKAVATDVAIGAPPIIGGRRQHREFLRRNGYTELGNEKPRQELQFGPARGEIARELKRALGE